MRVLVACEESQAVTKEFRRLGHEAYSCDIIDQSGGHPEWHIMQDVLPLLNGSCSFKTTDGVEHTISGRWDMIIAFPPCTKTSNAGARHLWKGGRLNIPRYFDGLCGKALFLAIWAADCEKVVIENPTPSKVFEYPKPTQSVQPYEFGHPFTKKRFYGSEVLSLSSRLMSSLQRERGALPVLTQESTKKSIEGCSRKTGQKTEAKHSRALQKQWLSNGRGKQRRSIPMSRITKDEYYLNIALAVARRSTCLRRQYGAVIVKYDCIISTGYNGSARGEPNCCDVGECWRQANNIQHGEQYEKCMAVHAEDNAISQAGRDAIGATLYLAGL